MTQISIENKILNLNRYLSLLKRWMFRFVWLLFIKVYDIHLLIFPQRHEINFFIIYFFEIVRPSVINT